MTRLVLAVLPHVPQLVQLLLGQHLGAAPDLGQPRVLVDEACQPLPDRGAGVNGLERLRARAARVPSTPARDQSRHRLSCLNHGLAVKVVLAMIQPHHYRTRVAHRRHVRLNVVGGIGRVMGWWLHQRRWQR